MKDSVLNSFNSLEQYCKKEDFKGWDPYDGLTSKIFNALPILPNKRISRLIWIQLIKKLPFNLRGILRIEKGYNPKGLALFISGYSKISQSRNSDAIQQINRLCEKVIELQTQGFSGSCWGYNFDWESRAFFQKKFTPTIVVTTYVSNALLDAYEATKNKDYLNLAISSKDFIIKDLKRTYNDNGNLAFSYSPFDSTSVFNASLLGAKLLSRIYTYTNEKELISLAKKAVAYCCDYQNADGSWFYSPLPFHQWIDNFHTGFNLECIYEYGLFAKDDSFEKNFNDGMSYYLKTFFDKEGRSKYYNNSLYPIDIHSPSQLIITLAKTNLFAKNRKLIDRVVNWTIENMQSPKGYFYFQKRKFYANKIPFMRWSEGWMFYGLAHYLQNTLEGEKAA
jgi:hypothetical protein